MQLRKFFLIFGLTIMTTTQQSYASLLEHNFTSITALTTSIVRLCYHSDLSAHKANIKTMTENLGDNYDDATSREIKTTFLKTADTWDTTSHEQFIKIHTLSALCATAALCFNDPALQAFFNASSLLLLSGNEIAICLHKTYSVPKIFDKGQAAVTQYLKEHSHLTRHRSYSHNE